MESENQENQFAEKGGEALNLDDGEAFSDAAADPQSKEPEEKPAAGKAAKDIKGEKLDNQPYDLAVDVNDDDSDIESDEEEDEVNEVARTVGQSNVNPQSQQPSQSQSQAAAQSQASAATGAAAKAAMMEEEEGEDDKEVPGTYNPGEYADLPVASEVKDLFEYIQRYKPQKIELETKLKPFIPDYIPAVGEVDGALKMSKPDGQKEDLGIVELDEPALNCEDKTKLTLQYLQTIKTTGHVSLEVSSIDAADKKPKEITKWISSVEDLHKTRPAPTVNYSKQMPDFDQLMQEFPPEMERALRDFQFPGEEIDMQTSNYARVVLSMLDIPVHKLQNDKSLIESLHVLFTIYSEFKQNQHFQNNPAGNSDVMPL